ncbi:MAG: NmrA family NAD(P)-binding protein [Hymenobacteraceae bacterium]|nr:NmrA family NAD(P)-binding protein [Hymenobacteraceae bacterium]MDX5397299.1 NmrA family NAD(P)-binding protein [Hymenobacteraceae bacterium]MDX5513377.1 NmrA family NAD(P)-binding protein [Hymenobacteraceae bacterium]
MKNILITGATGNVGSAILQHYKPAAKTTLYKASRSKNLQPDELYFDFEDLENSHAALLKTDILFLLRPPHISDVDKYIAPLIQACVEEKVQHIVFLSVQGADKVSVIPHAKIEKLILQSGLAYTSIRPSYFMQNLSTTLLPDIQNKKQIFLPAGDARFLWVDVNDIGKAIARVLENPEKYQQKSYNITGSELINFYDVAAMLSAVAGKEIKYICPNLLRFYLQKRREKVSPAFIMVMMLLHYLPRLQQEPEISSDFEILTGEKPKTLKQFIAEHKKLWQ